MSKLVYYKIDRPLTIKDVVEYRVLYRKFLVIKIS